MYHFSQVSKGIEENYQGYRFLRQGHRVKHLLLSRVPEQRFKILFQTPQNILITGINLLSLMAHCQEVIEP